MNVVFLGPPACGKGTQSQILVEKMGFYHFSTGDIMRAEVASKSDLGLKIEDTINTGSLVGSELVNELLKKDVEKNHQKSILFDGYPRKVDQAQYLDELLASFGKQVDVAFCFDIPAEILMQRITGRITCKFCGSVYNTLLNPPKVKGVCDSCGGNEFAHREDDNEVVLAKRVTTFYEETLPVKEYYQSRQVLNVIDAQMSVEQVAKQIESALKMRS